MDVSIIIVNFNSSKYTINCIKSIYKFTTDIDFEIIIVDNDSDEKDVLSLTNYLHNKNIVFIKSKNNLGFGGGNHLGYQFAKGDYLAFVNNDAELIENSLLKLKNYIETDLSIGVLGLHQINKDGEKFKYSYRQFIGLKYHLLGQSKPENYYKQQNQELNIPFTVDLVSGAFMFFQTEAYEISGGFDPNIFLFYEEMDICLRLKKHGFKTQFYPNSTFIHYLGKSSANVALKREFTISYLYVIQKNYHYLYFIVLRLVLVFKYFFKSIIKPKKYLVSLFIALKGGNSAVYSMKIKH